MLLIKSQRYNVHGKHLQEQENLDKALDYIRLGRELFEYDVDLIIAELNYHLANQDFEKQELLTLAIEEVQIIINYFSH